MNSFQVVEEMGLLRQAHPSRLEEFKADPSYSSVLENAIILTGKLYKITGTQEKMKKVLQRINKHGTNFLSYVQFLNNLKVVPIEICPSQGDPVHTYMGIFKN